MNSHLKWFEKDKPYIYILGSCLGIECPSPQGNSSDQMWVAFSGTPTSKLPFDTPINGDCLPFPNPVSKIATFTLTQWQFLLPTLLNPLSAPSNLAITSLASATLYWCAISPQIQHWRLICSISLSLSHSSCVLESFTNMENQSIAHQKHFPILRHISSYRFVCTSRKVSLLKQHK